MASAQRRVSHQRLTNTKPMEIWDWLHANAEPTVSLLMEKFNIKKSLAYCLMKEFQDAADVAEFHVRKPRCSQATEKQIKVKLALREILTRDCAHTLKSVKKTLRRVYKLQLSVRQIRRVLKEKMGWTRKRLTTAPLTRNTLAVKIQRKVKCQPHFFCCDYKLQLVFCFLCAQAYADEVLSKTYWDTRSWYVDETGAHYGTVRLGSRG